MEREFGTKSYQPAKFDFFIIFEGTANMEYQRLFARKLPGNVLVSTYHTPMTISQLAIELGVASVYLEDEIALLEQYGLLTALPGGRYQARLVIFTEEYMEEFFRMAEKSAVPKVGNILKDGMKKLPDLRKLQFIGAGLEDNLLLWDLLFEMICKGWELFQSRQEEGFRKSGIYQNGDICYGRTYELGKNHPYRTDSFAGYCGIRPGYAASYADYGILPVQNRYTSYGETIADSLDNVLGGNAAALVPVISKEQREAIAAVLGEEIVSFASLFESLYDCAISVMRVHAPGSVEQIIGPVLAKVLLFHTVGMIGAFAVRSGALTIPEADCPLGGFLYQEA